MRKESRTGTFFFGLLFLYLIGKSQVGTQTFNFTGAVQTITVPSCIDAVSFSVTGAQGGTYSPGGTAGLGGLVTGIMTVTPGQVLNIYVGGQNGYNGGASGGINGNASYNSPSVGYAANGGGASDIRVSGMALTDRVIVAGGGGGTAANGVWTTCQVSGPAGNGGNGGGLVGDNGTYGVGNPCNCNGGGGSGGFGGTASAGGATGSYTNNTACLRSTWSPGSPGILGFGGAGSLTYHNGTGGGGGGGGGYYGGGSGASGSDTTPGGGGGGGSSYVAPGNTITTNSKGVQAGNGVVILSYISSNGNFVTVSPTTTSTCLGFSTPITASGAITYTWSSGASSFSINPSPLITTNFTVSGTNSCGVVSSAVVTVSVNVNPTISVNSGSICSGNSFSLIPSGASTYTIQGGSTFVTPLTTSNYTVNGTSAEGCLSVNTATSNVTVNPLPTIAASSNATLICKTESATLTATGATTYTWSNNALVPIITVSPNLSTTYTITGTDANGCVNSTTFTQNVSECTGSAKLGQIEVHFDVFPNPSNGIYIIDSENKLTISVYDALGKLIFDEKISEGKHQIDLSTFNNGLYILKAENNNRVKILRLIKE